MLVFFTDTDTDFSLKEAKEYGCHLISMPYSVNDKEIYPYVDFKEFDYKSFYNMLRSGVLPKTSAISPVDYINYFEPHLKNGDDILYVHFSKAMSGTFNAMNIAIEELKEKYPERKIYTIDTKGITICSYNICKEIGDLYKQGKSIDEILAWAEKEVDKFAIYFYADDLKFFAKSGRVSNFSATMGSLLSIHPIINIGEDGIMKNIGKSRGKVQTLNKILSYIEELGDDLENHRIIIGHSDALETAEMFADMLKMKFGNNLNIEFVVVNPTAGSHCGPSSIGVCFHAIHR